MKLVTPALVDAYLQRDPILARLDSSSRPGDESLTCQRWLREAPAKRLIFQELYGDLLTGPRRKVLDVGGGLTSITRLLAGRHDYTLVDLMAHDPMPGAAHLDEAGRSTRIVIKDWYEAGIEEGYDVAIANDLFPNVDQRLDLFLERVLPRAAEVRLALTYYNSPRFYLARRLQGDEILCMLAWDGPTTRRCLRKYERYIQHPNLALLSKAVPSPFANGRQVCLARLRGGGLRRRRRAA
jgi:hypothetical protein